MTPCGRAGIGFHYHQSTGPAEQDPKLEGGFCGWFSLWPLRLNGAGLSWGNQERIGRGEDRGDAGMTCDR